jgi:hypothetical protein
MERVLHLALDIERGLHRALPLERGLVTPDIENFVGEESGHLLHQRVENIVAVHRGRRESSE